MDTVKYRAWIYSRQGLERCQYKTARETLAQAGWQRSVGGVNPYLAIRARSGEDRAQVDALAESLQLFELPSARGCTYVLPAEHFALGLAIGRGFGSAGDVAIARKLGVQDAEVETLKSAVAAALSRGPLAPSELKTALGDAVRNLGEEGKRRGLTTTLPLALGLLQTEGRIRRKPMNGRLDTQRYDYELWDPALTDMPGVEEAAAEIARLFFGWAGAATLKDFRDFTAFTLRTTEAACAQAGIVNFGEETDLLCLPEARENYAAYRVPGEPAYCLVGNMDSYLTLRRTGSFWLHDDDRARLAPTGKGLQPMSQFAELWSHAILDRGRLIGLWEYDAEAERIVCSTWTSANEALNAAIEATERYIKEDLGDARSFSLDSPASRRPRLDAIRDLPAA